MATETTTKCEFMSISEFKSKFGLNSFRVSYNAKLEFFSILFETEKEFISISKDLQALLMEASETEEGIDPEGGFELFDELVDELKFWVPYNEKGTKLVWEDSYLIKPKAGESNFKRSSKTY